MDPVTAKIVAGCCILLGVGDLAASKLVFEKQQEKLSEQLAVTFERAARAALEQKLRTASVMRSTIAGIGIVFIIGGAFLLLH